MRGEALVDALSIGTVMTTVAIKLGPVGVSALAKYATTSAGAGTANTLADDMLAEADFAAKAGGINETTPFKDIFGKGVNASTLEEHLAIGGPNSIKQGVSGAHSKVAYWAERNSIHGIEVAPPQTIAPGIIEYSYNTPERIAMNKEPLIKTVYDSRYTDTQILEMSKKASSQVWSEIQKTGSLSTQNTTLLVIDGVPFRSLISKDKIGNISVYSHPGR